MIDINFDVYSVLKKYRQRKERLELPNREYELERRKLKIKWNTIKGEWTLGTYQTFSLRMALGASRKPKGGEGLK